MCQCNFSSSDQLDKSLVKCALSWDIENSNPISTRNHVLFCLFCRQLERRLYSGMRICHLFTKPKGLFTRYDFVACDKLTTGLRHELFRVNQTYNSLTTLKSCRRPVVSLSHATKSCRVNRPLIKCRERRVTRSNWLASSISVFYIINIFLKSCFHEKALRFSQIFTITTS